MWEWYIKPAVERSKAMDREIQKAKRGDVFVPETPEEIEQAMQMMKALFGGG